MVNELYPNFKFFGSQCGDDDPVDWPTIQPILEAWQNSPAADNWVQNANAVIPQEIKNVIQNAMVALECDNKDVWTRCLDLESKQERVRMLVM